MAVEQHRRAGRRWVSWSSRIAPASIWRCLPPLFRSPLRPRVLVVNSSSQDGTVERPRSWVPRRWWCRAGVQPRADARAGPPPLGTPVVVMLTPDAYALRRTTFSSG